tara:strand:- start:44181 stop:44528 length:348 start_codon:yes stop_codon:yes gene_type:complete
MLRYIVDGEDGKETCGPVSVSDAQVLYAKGIITDETLVGGEGMSLFRQLKDTDLFDQVTTLTFKKHVYEKENVNPTPSVEAPPPVEESCCTGSTCSILSVVAVIIVVLLGILLCA